MRKIIITLSVIFLISSCNEKIICAQIKKADLKPHIFCDISLMDKMCMCRCIDIETFRKVGDADCGAKFKSGGYSLKSCDGIGGFFMETWASKLKPKIKKLGKMKEKYCK